MNKFLSLFTAEWLFQFGIHADLKKDLNEFFDSFGASTNVSSAEVYEGQKAGYATGGSVTVRNRLLNSKILTVNLPKINAGCGGIDIYAGGMSFVSSEKLIENSERYCISFSWICISFGHRDSVPSDFKSNEITAKLG